MLANLKVAIAARGLRQIDLADQLEISPTALSELIHERRIPSAELRAQIAELLCADETWLFSSITYIPAPNADVATEVCHPGAIAPRTR